MKLNRPRIFLWLIPLILALLSGCSEPGPVMTPLATDAKVLAFGDSLTYGTGASRSQSYPSVLSELTGRSVINAGVPGEVSSAGVRRLAGLLAEHRPDLVVLCHGGNDILRRLDRTAMRQNLERMIALSREAGAQVILVAVPDFGILLSAAEDYEIVAEKTGVPMEADILPDVLSDDGLKSDSIHPNGAGYRRMAEAVNELLRETGAL